jgi:sugar/nucleoside kinase (ribokinase family)
VVAAVVTSPPARVIVVGDVIDDVIAAVHQPVRPDTDTPATIRRVSGGSGANTAVWLAAEGVHVDFCGRVGAHDVTRVSEEFIQAGVVPHLSPDPDRETGRIVIVVQGDVRTMLSDRGANVALDPRAIDPTILAGAGWLHLTGYSFFHHEVPERFQDLMESAKALGVGVMVDASSSGFLADFGPQRFLHLVAGAELFRCNEEEARLLTDSDSPEQSLEALAALFPRVMITRGPRGSLVWEKGAPHMIAPVRATELADSTGAGDAYKAGILAGLARGHDLVGSVERASALAALCVTRLGARP